MSNNTSNNTKIMMTKSGRQLQSDGDSLIITEPNGKQQTVYCSKLTDKMIKEIAHDPDEARKMLECCRHDIQQCRKHNCPECKVCPQNGGGNDCAPYKNKAYLVISVLLASFLIYGTYMIANYGLGYYIWPVNLFEITPNEGIFSYIWNLFKSLLRIIVTVVLGPLFVFINGVLAIINPDKYNIDGRWEAFMVYFLVLGTLTSAYISIIFYPLYPMALFLIGLIIGIYFNWDLNDIMLTQKRLRNSAMRGGANTLPGKIPTDIKKPSSNKGKIITGPPSVTEVSNLQIGNSRGKIVDQFGVMAPVYYLLAKAGKTKINKNKEAIPEDLISQKNMKQIAAMTESLNAVHKKATKVLGISPQNCPPCEK